MAKWWRFVRQGIDAAAGAFGIPLSELRGGFSEEGFKGEIEVNNASSQASSGGGSMLPLLAAGGVLWALSNKRKKYRRRKR